MVPEDGPKMLLRQQQPLDGCIRTLDNKDAVFNAARSILKSNRVGFDDISEIVLADPVSRGWSCQVTLSSTDKVQMLRTVEKLNRDGKFPFTFLSSLSV